MKKLALFVSVALVGLVMGSSIAGAKVGWKKDLGAANCGVCHLDDKKAPNESNKLWKASADMVKKYPGKPCAECHKGQMKPPK